MVRSLVLQFCDRGGKSCGFVEPRLVTRGMTSSPLLIGRRTGTLPFQPLIACHIGLIFLDHLIHLLRGQLALIFSYFGVQDMSNLLFNSIQRNLILEGSKLFLHELILPILAQIVHRGADSYQKVYSSLLGLLAEVLYGVSLLPKGEQSAIVFSQHLEESSQVLGIPRVKTEDPVEHIGCISSQR